MPCDVVTEGAVVGMPPLPAGGRQHASIGHTNRRHAVGDSAVIRPRPGPQIDRDRNAGRVHGAAAGTAPDDPPRGQPGQLGSMFPGGRVGMQRHVHESRQLAGQVDNDPVRGVRPEVGEPVAAAEAHHVEVVGKFD